jgi:hypothetical protein
MIAWAFRSWLLMISMRPSSSGGRAKASRARASDFSVPS